MPAKIIVCVMANKMLGCQPLYIVQQRFLPARSIQVGFTFKSRKSGAFHFNQAAIEL